MDHHPLDKGLIKQIITIVGSEQVLSSHEDLICYGYDATHLEAVVTRCMGCLIPLQDGVHQRAMGTRVIHMMEILEETLGSP